MVETAIRDIRDGVLSHLVRLTVAACVAAAAAPAGADESIGGRIEALIPDLETYIERNMKAFDSPGLAIGIVAGDELAFAAGYGARSRGGEAVDPQTLFQIGSTTKAFLAATLAIGVDRDLFDWNDRVAELDPDFAMNDPWVTREFRVFDLLAQRSGMPPSANDLIGLLGGGRTAMVDAMRHVEPAASFRSAFSYTNVTHLVADRLVARAFGAESWNAVAQSEILDPLGLDSTSFTADAMASAANHAEGYRWAPEGSVEVPLTPSFPYAFGGAGNMNSNVEDMTRWIRFQLGGGLLAGERLVSAENMGATRTARIGLDARRTYANGWLQQATPNGRIIWHNGGTTSFGAFVGFEPDLGIGVVVLTNLTNVGLPDAVGFWTLNRLMGNSGPDLAAASLAGAQAGHKQRMAPLEAARAGGAATLHRDRLAGEYESAAFGMITLHNDRNGLTAKLETTGAVFALEDMGESAFAATLMPVGRFADIAANLGPAPFGDIVFETDGDGEVGGFRLIDADNGQPYEFRRIR